MDNIIYAIKDFGIFKTIASALVVGLFILAFVNGGGKSKGGSGNSNSSTANSNSTPNKP